MFNRRFRNTMMQSGDPAGVDPRSREWSPGPITPLAAAVVSALYPGAAAQAQSEAGGIEEIVVTATKRAVNLQDVPQSITAFSTADIEKMAFRGMEDYMKALPSASLISSMPGRNSLAMRGITTGAYEYRTDSQVAVYLDEQPVTSISQQPEIRDDRHRAARVAAGAAGHAVRLQFAVRHAAHHHQQAELRRLLRPGRRRRSKRPRAESGATTSAGTSTSRWSTTACGPGRGILGRHEGGWVDNVEGPTLPVRAPMAARATIRRLPRTTRTSTTCTAGASPRCGTSATNWTADAELHHAEQRGRRHLGLRSVPRRSQGHALLRGVARRRLVAGVGDLQGRSRLRRVRVHDFVFRARLVLRMGQHGLQPVADELLRRTTTASRPTISNTSSVRSSISRCRSAVAQEFRLTSLSESKLAVDGRRVLRRRVRRLGVRRLDPDPDADQCLGRREQRLGRRVCCTTAMCIPITTMAPATMRRRATTWPARCRRRSRPTSTIYSKTIKQSAVFGELTYNLTDDWTITGGARWFQFDRERSPGLPGAGRISAVRLLWRGRRGVRQRGQERRHGLQAGHPVPFHRRQDGLRAVQRGLPPRRLQQPAGRGDRAMPEQYGPDTIKNYEIGLKSEWFDNAPAC